jgi:selenocysteine lyase/cysteine desulfurase
MDAGGIDRRTFVAGGAMVAGAVLAGCSSGRPIDGRQASTPGVDAGRLDEDWEAVRGQFLLDPDLAHFAAWTLSAHPAPVRDAIERFRTRLDGDTAALLDDEQRNEQKVRDAAGRYLGVDPMDVALTDSTTMGLGVVFAGLPLRPGDHVLTTTHDFYSMHEALRLCAARTGAEVERVALYDEPADASVGEMVSRLRAAMRPTTRVLALTWVHSSTGVKTPLPDISMMLAEVNARRHPRERVLLCVDGVHGLGVEVTGPAAMGCDVFVAGTHKWLFGPRGTGVAWARPEVGRLIAPVIPPFNAPNVGNWLTGDFYPDVFGLSCTPGGYHSFEHRWALAAAFEFQLAIGMHRVAERTHTQAAQLKEGLARLSGVRVVTPRDPQVSSGIVCCEVEGADPAELATRLRRDSGIVVSVTPYREQFLRIGPSIVTTPTQVDDVIDALGKPW